MPHRCGIDDEVPVAGVLLEGALEDGVVAIGLDDRGAQIVEDDSAGGTAEEGPGVLEAVDEVGDRLRMGDVDVGVAAVASSTSIAQSIRRLPVSGRKRSRGARSRPRRALRARTRPSGPSSADARRSRSASPRTDAASCRGRRRPAPSQELMDLRQPQPPLLARPRCQPGWICARWGRSSRLRLARRSRGAGVSRRPPGRRILRWARRCRGSSRALAPSLVAADGVAGMARRPGHRRLLSPAVPTAGGPENLPHRHLSIRHRPHLRLGVQTRWAIGASEGVDQARENLSIRLDQAREKLAAKLDQARENLTPSGGSSW